MDKALARYWNAYKHKGNIERPSNNERDPTRVRSLCSVESQNPVKR